MTGRERLLAACRGERVDATPVWFMRQAGGRLPAYRALRERHSVLEIAKTPALAAEVAAGAADVLGTDGAVLFADIMLLVEALGIGLDLTEAGPVVERPIRSAADLRRLRPLDADADLGFVLESIRLVRASLGERAAIVGILGGPFTLASYLVDGAASRDQIRARILMHADPGTWHDLLDRLTVASIDYARAQAAAGADVLQLFDTWAATLTAFEYEAFVAPYTRRILAAVDVPTVHYVARSASILAAVAATGPTVVALDSRQSLASARDRLGDRQAIQGNLDPALVMAGWRQAADGATAVLDANAGRPGHVFNVGEAAPRDADPARLRDLVAFVHDRTAAAGAGAGAHTPEAAHAIA
ncbi:MAG TPA: uroporphyrinogen decarboxylase family protein [Candidatus Limnocylindrales bacterium]|nr:uroporphyrinogen decarboxylase family protein [Candidatus Limnocylindrales bacterium]